VSQRIVLLVSFVTTNKRNEQQGLSALEELACGPEPLELLSHMFLVGTNTAQHTLL
jgi:hypothetical protein